MKKVIAWLLVLALTAAISIGATLAYLTDTDEDVNVMTLGKVKIDQLEYERIDDETKNEDAKVQEFHDNKPLYPGVYNDNFDFGIDENDPVVDWTQKDKEGYTSGIWNPEEINNELDKMVFVKNKGDYDAYVRSVFAFEAGNYTTKDEFLSMVHLNLNETDWTWEWMQTPVAIPNADGTGTTNYFIATVTYNKVLAPEALTEISLSQIALDKTATNADVEALGDTYQVLVKSQGIQADGFDDPAFALNEGFGVIDANNIPWENDNPTKGGTMNNALHHLNADVSLEKITTKVKTVTFGLTKDYESIAADNKGVLVDVGQDVPVHAYYVENGSNYDVYFLADDVIYAPANSDSLFDGMSALSAINVKDLDVSRVETMQKMFNGCKALINLDLTGWDTGNVTNLKLMFQNCSNLVSIDGTANLDVSEVTDMYGVFNGCKKLVEVDASGWDTGNVTTVMGMFNGCSVLETVKFADWDTSNVVSFSAMFQQASKVKNIDPSKWDTSSAEDMSGMFKGCVSIEELDVSNWKVDKVKKFNSMFSGAKTNGRDMKIKELNVSKWNPVSATHMNHMFYGCAQLTAIDVSDWQMPDLYTTSHMFSDCAKLVTIDVSGWYTPSLYSMDAMFNNCDSVKFLNMSSFDTSNVGEFSQIFEFCYSLKEIQGLNNWNTSNGVSFTAIFNNCNSLRVLDLSSFDTHKAYDGYKSINGVDTNSGFNGSFVNMLKLEKLILGENFCFNGDGTVKYPVTLPNPGDIDGQTALWYNEANDTYYTASEIPEPKPGDGTVTYVAAIPPAENP